MSDLLQFTSDIYSSFYKIGLLEKCAVGAVFGYASFKVIVELLKKLLMPIYRLTKRKNDPADTSKYDPQKIYVHMFYRRATKQVPNLSPYAIKLETWLRMKDIEYEVVETRNMSNATRQIPYVNHKGNELTDSDLIIEYLEKEHNLDENETLSLEDAATARAFRRMMDESTCWTYFIHRYYYEYRDFTKVFGTPFLNILGKTVFNNVFPKIIRKTAENRGIGRKKRSEVYHIGQEDIRAISIFLGNKSFMMGDKMTKVDCSMFGHLSQIVFVDFHYPHMDFIKDECTNIIPYMERIKTKCWPDWDAIVHKGHFW